MPAAVSEITEGVAFSRSSEDGTIADAQPRVFRVILNDPNELIDIEGVCGVRIGDELRPGAKIYCTSYDARYEGSSRLSLLCTFQFRTTASAAASAGGSDPKSQSPNIRPANWTTSTSLVEVPVSVWSKRTDPAGAWAAPEPAVNPVGDMYDGVTALVPVVTINITQFNATDPTVNLRYAGYVNAETINIGNLSMIPGTVLFRGVSYQPVVESWGGLTFRGWTATYEFAYRRNTMKVGFGFGDPQVADIGWDVAVPVTGFNVRAFDPSAPGLSDDIYGQPLRHNNGKIVPPLLLPDGISPGDRVRAMVRVFEYEEGGTSQLPSASPVALQLNGRPLQTHDSSGTLINEPLVFAYQTQPRIDLTATLGIRYQ